MYGIDEWILLPKLYLNPLLYMLDVIRHYFIIGSFKDNSVTHDKYILLCKTKLYTPFLH